MPTTLYKSRLIAFKRQNGRCFYCEYPMWLESPEEITASNGIRIADAFRFKCTAEHLVARQDGGKDSRGNIVAACSFCNRTRHRAKSPQNPMIYRKRVIDRLRSGKWHPK